MTLIPFATVALIAGSPASVPGILIITLGALDRSPQALGVRDRPFGIVRQVRGDLQADVAVHPVQALVDGPQDVCGVADVPPGEGLEDLRRGHPGPGRLAQQVVVVRAAGDGLLEDGGVDVIPSSPCSTRRCSSPERIRSRG